MDLLSTLKASFATIALGRFRLVGILLTTDKAIKFNEYTVIPQAVFRLVINIF